MGASRPDSGAPPWRVAVAAHFEDQAEHWAAIYRSGDVHSVVHQVRRQTALAWVHDLALPRDSAVLELGCGTGGAAVALAAEGLRVRATDVADAMLAATSERVRKAGVEDRVTVGRADAHHLEFSDASFDLVFGLGVLPWLEFPGIAIAEISRVVRPGGWVLVNTSNDHRLPVLLDPRTTPLLRPVRATIKEALVRTGSWPARAVPMTSSLVSNRAVDRLFDWNGLEIVRSTTVGFGPFTFFLRPVLRPRTSLRVHRVLQRLADRRVPVLRSTGAHYLVLARRRP